ALQSCQSEGSPALPEALEAGGGGYRLERRQPAAHQCGRDLVSGCDRLGEIMDLPPLIEMFRHYEADALPPVAICLAGVVQCSDPPALPTELMSQREREDAQIDGRLDPITTARRTLLQVDDEYDIVDLPPEGAASLVETSRFQHRVQFVEDDLRK